MTRWVPGAERVVDQPEGAWCDRCHSLRGCLPQQQVKTEEEEDECAEDSCGVPFVCLLLHTIRWSVICLCRSLFATTLPSMPLPWPLPCMMPWKECPSNSIASAI